MTPETDKERDEARAQVEIITPHENNPVAEYFSSPNTPETDARAYKFNDEDGVHCEAVHADFARRLERERDEAREAIHIAESLIKPQIEREQVTPEAKPDNDKQRDMTALLGLLREVRRERDEARNELEDYKASTIHSCNEECKRPMCVLRRQRREAREDAEHWKTEYLIVAARLCGKKHPRDNGIISEHEIIPKLERERDEAREVLWMISIADWKTAGELRGMARRALETEK